MGIGASTFLMAVGAILTFAVTRTYVAGVKLQVVGIILMIIGAIGLIAFLTAFAPRRRSARPADYTEERVVRDRDVY